MKFGSGNLSKGTEKTEQNNTTLAKELLITPEMKIKELEDQTRKCAQLLYGSKSKHSYFSQNNQGSMELSKYRMQGRVLGEGAFAIVRTAIQSTTGKFVAIKTYNKLKIVDKSKLKAISRESELIQKLDSPFVMKFFEKIENTRNIHLVMEYAGKFNLKTYVESKEGLALKPVDLQVMLRSIVKGLDSIHSANIVHRDLKMENIVLNTFDCPKIVDFGFAREKESKMGICGTLNYMSPEILDRPRILDMAEKSDIWALGVIFYYVFTKKFPFGGQTETEIKRQIKENVIDVSTIEDAKVKDLILKILDRNYKLRPSCSEILAMPYFC